jgi:hypothetical protein
MLRRVRRAPEQALMPREVAAGLGLLAGAVAVLGTLPYLRDTLRGATRPHRGTWLVWSALGAVACLSQRAGGASWSLGLSAGAFVLDSLVFALALRTGQGSLDGPEAALLGLAAGGVAAWLLAGPPLAATAGVIAPHLAAAAMMAPKAYRDPRSETLVTFAGASLGGALAAGAASAGDPALLLYPAYYCAVNAALAALIALRRGAGDL